MINFRESEIRNEALSMVVETYRVTNLLPKTVDMKTRNKLIDGTFHISSRIAESFNAIHNEECADAIKSALEQLIEVKILVTEIQELIGNTGKIIDHLQFCIEELYVELTELLAALKQITRDPYTPKLESACF